MAMTLDGTNGVFLPTWTTATRPASPSNGEIGYNSTTGALDQYVGGTWASVPTGATSAATPTALGTVYGNTLSGGLYTTAGGYEALTTNTAGVANTAFGFRALKLNTTDSNTAFGYNALTSTTTGGSNIGIGVNAGSGLSTGNSNIFIGEQSGTASTTATANVYIGRNSGKTNTAGNYNVGLGLQALEASNGNGTTTNFENTAIGSYALYQLTNGRSTTAIGYAAGGNATTGTFNTYLGRQAGGSHATGDGCVYVGNQTNASSTSVGNEIVIGYSITGQGGATASIGDNVGKVYVNYRSSGTWTQTSDGRLKKNITPDTLGLSFVCRLNPVTYQWKASNELEQDNPYYAEENNRDTETIMHGLVAQEVKTALDAEGVNSFDGWKLGIDGIQNISREMFVTPLIKAIQELKVLVDAQATEIAELKAKVG